MSEMIDSTLLKSSEFVELKTLIEGLGFLLQLAAGRPIFGNSIAPMYLLHLEMTELAILQAYRLLRNYCNTLKAGTNEISVVKRGCEVEFKNTQILSTFLANMREVLILDIEILILYGHTKRRVMIAFFNS